MCVYIGYILLYVASKEWLKHVSGKGFRVVLPISVACLSESCRVAHATIQLLAAPFARFFQWERNGKNRKVQNRRQGGPKVQ